MSFKNFPKARFLLHWATHKSSASSSSIPISIKPTSPCSSHRPDRTSLHDVAAISSASPPLSFTSPPFEILIPEPLASFINISANSFSEEEPFSSCTASSADSNHFSPTMNPSLRLCNTANLARLEIEPSFKVRPIHASNTRSNASLAPSREAPSGNQIASGVITVERFGGSMDRARSWINEVLPLAVSNLSKPIATLLPSMKFITRYPPPDISSSATALISKPSVAQIFPSLLKSNLDLLSTSPSHPSGISGSGPVQTNPPFHEKKKYPFLAWSSQGSIRRVGMWWFWIPAWYATFPSPLRTYEALPNDWWL